MNLVFFAQSRNIGVSPDLVILWYPLHHPYIWGLGPTQWCGPHGCIHGPGWEPQCGDFGATTELCDFAILVKS